MSFEGYGDYRVGQVPGDYSPHPRIPRTLVGALDAGSLFALDAALQAIDAAGLGTGSGDARRFAVVDGLAYRAPGQSALFVGYGQSIARVLGVRGPVLEIGGAEASGAAAVVEGARIVASGEADVAIAGAAQAIQGQILAHLAELGLSSSGPARPFDRSHDGCLPAEGAAYLVLEAEDHARARSCEPTIFVESATQSFDPGTEPLDTPRPEAAGRAQQDALARAGVAQNQIDLIVSCADGRPSVDFSDAYGIRRTFGDHAGYVPVTTPAGAVGHTLAASAPLAIVVAAQTLERQMVVPIAGLVEAEPDLDLSYAREASGAALERAMVTSLGLGGTCAAFVLRRETEA